MMSQLGATNPPEPDQITVLFHAILRYLAPLRILSLRLSWIEPEVLAFLLGPLSPFRAAVDLDHLEGRRSSDGGGFKRSRPRL